MFNAAMPASKPFICPECNHTQCYEGPSGGFSINVTCAYRKCRHEWNWSSPIEYYEDIGITEEDDRNWDDEVIPPQQSPQFGIIKYLSILFKKVSQ